MLKKKKKNNEKEKIETRRGEGPNPRWSATPETEMQPSGPYAPNGFLNVESLECVAFGGASFSFLFYFNINFLRMSNFQFVEKPKRFCPQIGSNSQLCVSISAPFHAECYLVTCAQRQRQPQDAISKKNDSHWMGPTSPHTQKKSCVNQFWAAKLLFLFKDQAVYGVTAKTQYFN